MSTWLLAVSLRFEAYGIWMVTAICWWCRTFYYDLLALSSHYQQYTLVPSNSQQFINVVCSELFIRHCGSVKWVNEHQGEPYKDFNLMMGTRICPITEKLVAVSYCVFPVWHLQLIANALLAYRRETVLAWLISRWVGRWNWSIAWLIYSITWVGGDWLSM